MSIENVIATTELSEHSDNIPNKELLDKAMAILREVMEPRSQEEFNLKVKNFERKLNNENDLRRFKLGSNDEKYQLASYFNLSPEKKSFIDECIEKDIRFVHSLGHIKRIVGEDFHLS